jgi:beta-lactamase class D
MKKSCFSVCMLAILPLAAFADSTVHECMIVEAIDGSFQYNSSISECSHATSPASTFKIPHALIAMEAGVITDPESKVPWDGTAYPNELWRQDHSMNSAIKWSALWFFQLTASLTGEERMHAGMQSLDYANDSFEGELTDFWRNGDLVVTPEEQVAFLHRLVENNLPVKQAHIDAVKAAFLMPAGKITLASGEHPLLLDIPGLREVHAKTGNAAAGGENVSWLVGYLGVGDKTYVFAARVRSGERLATTAGAALAQAVLNAQLQR